MSAKVTKKQHFVPRFYLSRFLNKNNEAEIIDCEHRKIISPRGPKGICYEDFYYGVETGTKDEISQKIEQAFEAMETEISKVIPKFIDDIINRRQISPCQKRKIAALMSMLWVRGPVMRSSVNNMEEDMMKQVVAHMFSGAIGEDILNLTDEKSGAKLSLDMRDSVKKMMCNGEFSLKFNNQLHIEMFSEISKYETLFNAQHWTVYISNTSKKFVTSDNPVVMYIPKREGWFEATFSERVHYFSLSPDICIESRYASHKIGKNLVRKTLYEKDNNVVLMLNLQISNKSHQYTYSKNRECLEDILMFIKSRDEIPHNRVNFKESKLPFLTT